MRVARRLRSRDALLKIHATGPSGTVFADMDVTVGSVVTRRRTEDFFGVVIPAIEPRRETVSFRIEQPGFRPYTSTVEIGAGETRVVSAVLVADDVEPEPEDEPPP